MSLTSFRPYVNLRLVVYICYQITFFFLVPTEETQTFCRNQETLAEYQGYSDECEDAQAGHQEKQQR